MRAISTAGLNFCIAAMLDPEVVSQAFTIETWCRLDKLDPVNGAYPLGLLTKPILLPDGHAAGAGTEGIGLGARATTRGNVRWTLFLGALEVPAPVSQSESEFDAKRESGPNFSSAVELPAPTGWTRVSLAVDGGGLVFSLDAQPVITMKVPLSGAGITLAGATFCMTHGPGFTATCDFAGARLWTRALSRTDISRSASAVVLTDSQDVAADWVIEGDPPVIAAHGTGGHALVAVPQGLNLADHVVDATALGVLPTIVDAPVAAVGEQPPPVLVPEGGQDRMLISHLLPDTVVHTGRRVIEMDVKLVAPTGGDPKPPAKLAAAALPQPLAANPPVGPPGSPGNVVDGGRGMVPIDDYRAA